MKKFIFGTVVGFGILLSPIMVYAGNENYCGHNGYEQSKGSIILSQVEMEDGYDEQMEEVENDFMERIQIFFEIMEKCQVEPEFVENLDILDIFDDELKQDRTYNLKENITFLSEPFYEITSDSFSGYMYIGDIEDNRPDGRGVLFRQDYNKLSPMIKYIGEFREGRFDGKGFDLGDEELASMYLGEYEDGKYEGNGIKIMIDLLYFSGYTLLYGEFWEGNLNGYGKEYYNGILSYEGEFEDGCYEGNGICYYQNGNKFYEGEFREGEFEGYGIQYDENENVIYEGKWKNGDYSAD